MKKAKYFLVNYSYQIGDFETFEHALIKVEDEEKPEHAIHNYFFNFWGNEIEKYKKLRKYYNFDRAIEIEFWKEIPKKDAEILKQYLIPKILS